MLVSAKAELVAKARFLATQARDPGIAYEHSQTGYNYRMSNVLAGIGRGQMEVLELRVEQRRAIFDTYRKALASVPGVTPMPEAPFGRANRWLSCFLIDEKQFGCSRDRLIALLDEANIETRPVWKPMHLQKLFEDCEYYGGAVAEDLFSRGICLPSSSSLTVDEVSYVARQIAEAPRRAAAAREAAVV
jgi:dTDP-4-amino-4,6-dideoxygalactose transaminase